MALQSLARSFNFFARNISVLLIQKCSEKEIEREREKIQKILRDQV